MSKAQIYYKTRRDFTHKKASLLHINLYNQLLTMKKLKFLSLCAILVWTACQSKPTPPAQEAPMQPSPGKPMTKTTCYDMRMNGDVTAIELTVVGDQVSGFYAWEPKEKDSAHGMFKGVKSGDEITADFVYMIEGSVQTEEVVFKVAGNKLMQGRGELEDKAGKLVIKDRSKLAWDETFTETDCANIQEPIARAVEMHGMILKQQQGN